ncbi:MAG: LamG domain-containing protein [Planctomycetota bacterium]
MLFAAFSLPLAAADSPLVDKPALSKGGKLYKWGDVKPDDVGDFPVKYDAIGVRPFPKAPPPGAHPRIYFGPEEIPDIRRRLKETRAGRENWLNAMAWIMAMKGPYDREADYAKRNGKKCMRVQIYRSVGHRYEGVGKLWKKLTAGTYEHPGIHWSVFSLEAFRCLMEEDEEAARTLIDVLILVVKGEQAERAAGIDRSQPVESRVDPKSILPAPAVPKEVSLDLRDDAADGIELEEKPEGGDEPPATSEKAGEKPVGIGKPYSPVGGENLALCYDFLYNWMTKGEQDFIRKEIAFGTDYHAHYGTFALYYKAISNWIPLDSFLPITLLAIEGEEGFNDLKYAGTIRAWRCFLTYGWHPSGEGWEGRGKNYQFNTTMVAFAKRGDNLFAHPHVRAYGNNLLFHALQPTRNGFVAHDLWGGSCRPMGNDPIGLKFAFPHDKRVDWVYRNSVGEDYSRLPGSPGGIIPALVCAMDYDEENDDPGKIANGFSFFCPDRGLMHTRSDWTENALFLTMHTRQTPGGHTFSDRNSFALTGAGRFWATHGTHAWSNLQQNVVVIDGIEQATKSRARVVDYGDNELATFMTGDATFAWRWATESKFAVTGGLVGRWDAPLPVRALETPNDFRYRPASGKHYNRSTWGTPNWLNPDHIDRPMKRKLLDVRHVYRSAGIIRGKHPFALVIDDMEVDGKVHHFDWLMQLPSDIAVQAQRGSDILLYGGHPLSEIKGTRAPKPGEPMLLVRLLQCEQSTPDVQGPHINREIFHRTWWGMVEEAVKLRRMGKPVKETAKTLVIPSVSVSPKYKVLFYPHHYGDALPKTTWGKGRERLTVAWDDETTTIDLPVDEAGRTQVIVRRGADGAPGFSLAGTIRPMPARDAEERERRVKIRRAKAKALKKEMGDFTPESLTGRIPFTWPDLPAERYGPGVVGRAVTFTAHEKEEEAKIIVDKPKIVMPDTLGVDDDDELGEEELLEGLETPEEEPAPDQRILLPGGLPPYGNRTFSICFWVKAKPKGGAILQFGGGHKGLQMSIHQDRNLRVDCMGQHYWSNTPWQTKIWTHGVLTCDGKVVRWYRDGKLLKEGKATGFHDLTYRATAGADLTGAIDDLRFYKRALTTDEVKKLYNYQRYVVSPSGEDNH